MPRIEAPAREAGVVGAHSGERGALEGAPPRRPRLCAAHRLGEAHATGPARSRARGRRRACPRAPARSVRRPRGSAAPARVAPRSSRASRDRRAQRPPRCPPRSRSPHRPPSWRTPSSRLGVSTAVVAEGASGREPSRAMRTRVTSASDAASRFPSGPDTASVPVRTANASLFAASVVPSGAAVEQHRAHPQRPHREVEVGAKRRATLRRARRGERERPLAVARHRPHREALR